MFSGDIYYGNSNRKKKRLGIVRELRQAQEFFYVQKICDRVICDKKSEKLFFLRDLIYERPHKILHVYMGQNYRLSN